MAADTNVLINDAKCIAECVPGGDMKLAILISLFAKIAGVSTDTNALIDGAKCIYACVPGTDMKLSILISLASQAISGGPNGLVSCGAGAPTSTPSSGCAMYIQTDSIPPGVVWQYYGGVWH
jgi:hypothetical protein